MQYIYYGNNSSIFNSLKEDEKELFVIWIVFKVLYSLFSWNEKNIKTIWEVELLIRKFKREITIFYKKKETKKYEIILNYQIKLINDYSKIIVNFFDKEKNIEKYSEIDILHHEDIYYLVDTISFWKNIITFNPKKSYRSELVIKTYNIPMPLSVNIENMKDISRNF